MHHDDRLSGTKSFIKGKSTSNQRIESYWSQMWRQGVNFWIGLFKDMRDNNLFNDSNQIHVQCLRYCFGPLIKYDLEMIRKQWNQHRIRKLKSRESLPGKPNCLFYCPEKYGARDCKQKVEQHDIEVCINNYSIFPELINPEFEELIQLLIPDVIIPTTVPEAVALFVKCTDIIEGYGN